MKCTSNSAKMSSKKVKNYTKFCKITNHWTGPRAAQLPFSSFLARPVSSTVKKNYLNEKHTQFKKNRL